MGTMLRVLEWIHRVEKPKRTRDPEKPMSVICCGMSRSGTDSLGKALVILGYTDIYHGRNLVPNPGDVVAWNEAQHSKWSAGGPTLDAAFFDTIFGSSMAVVDFPGAVMGPELMQAYPAASVILNSRSDLDAWQRSVEVALAMYVNPPSWYEYFDTGAFWMRRYIEDNFDPLFRGSFRASGKRVYREHCAMIRGMTPPERLLEWQVEEGWEPLCTFLGKEVPDLPFPRGNSTAKMVPQLEAYARLLRKKAYWKIAVGLGWIGTAVATSMLLMRYRRLVSR